MSDVEMSQNDQQVCTQQSDLNQSTQLSRNLRWGTKEELKRKAELARVRYAAKHGAAKRKVPKSSTERSREMRARKKLLLQFANDQERITVKKETQTTKDSFIKSEVFNNVEPVRLITAEEKSIKQEFPINSNLLQVNIKEEPTDDSSINQTNEHQGSDCAAGTIDSSYFKQEYGDTDMKLDVDPSIDANMTVIHVIITPEMHDDNLLNYRNQIKVYRPKTATERVRAYRARKRAEKEKLKTENSEKAKPKTATERVREFRARKRQQLESNKLFLSAKKQICASRITVKSESQITENNCKKSEVFNNGEPVKLKTAEEKSIKQEFPFYANLLQVNIKEEPTDDSRMNPTNEHQGSDCAAETIDSIIKQEFSHTDMKLDIDLNNDANLIDIEDHVIIKQEKHDDNLHTENYFSNEGFAQPTDSSINQTNEHQGSDCATETIESLYIIKQEYGGADMKLDIDSSNDANMVDIEDDVIIKQEKHDDYLQKYRNQIKIYKPKTGAERMKAYRARKRAEKSEKNKPKTAAERSKAYRARKRAEKCEKEKPKTSTERVRKFRNRKRQQLGSNQSHLSAKKQKTNIDNRSQSNSQQRITVKKETPTTQDSFIKSEVFCNVETVWLETAEEKSIEQEFPISANLLQVNIKEEPTDDSPINQTNEHQGSDCTAETIDSFYVNGGTDLTLDINSRDNANLIDIEDNVITKQENYNDNLQYYRDQIKIYEPKTAAERKRAYRARKKSEKAKQKTEQSEKTKSKTSTERVREFRDRKRQQLNRNKEFYSQLA